MGLERKQLISIERIGVDMKKKKYRVNESEHFNLLYVKFWAESLAKEHNSSTVELKYFKDCTDEKIITYYLYYDETEGELVEGYRTEIEVEDGEYPEFVEYAETEIWQ